MKVHFLGTASALVTRDRDNSSLLVESGSDLILLDCGGNPAGKILYFNYRPADLNAVFLTHLHIDHCYGLPALLFHMFLEKRTTSLELFCPEEEFSALNGQLSSHDIENDVRTYSIHKNPVPLQETSALWETDDTLVYAGPAFHSRPTRAYRVIEKKSGRTVVFTGDTIPSDEVAKFAMNVDLLVHEATYLESHSDLASEYGHSTAGQAAQIALKANARALALIHFECLSGSSVEEYRSEAARIFKGRIYTPDDLSTLHL
ncbi:ribonuclease Z [bacterium]|nr:ribonuclease Z [candidate division CSSED10-310 bacterium]